jgi:hypothetical protein
VDQPEPKLKAAITREKAATPGIHERYEEMLKILWLYSRSQMFSFCPLQLRGEIFILI